MFKNSGRLLVQTKLEQSWSPPVSIMKTYEKNIAKGTTDPGVDCFDK